MLTLIVQSHLEELRQLCAKHHVRRLYLIGSGTRADFSPTESDLDFVVVFHKVERKGFDDVYFKLLHDLEGLFNRKVDLIEYDAIRNPYFKREVVDTRVPLYAA